MACLGCPSFCATKPAPSPSRSPSAVARPQPFPACAPPSSGVTLCLGHAQKCCFSLGIRRRAHAQPRPLSSPCRATLSSVVVGGCLRTETPPKFCFRVTGVVLATAKLEPLKIMISGAPASGKGTQCELIKEKYGLVHIAAGDLLRAEVAAGTDNGNRAKDYMLNGMLVPDEIVVTMVKERLLQPDAKENGWLLDGYPRSFSQAAALENLGIHPDLFILLEVDEDTLVERVVGRRLDPVTGRIYHLKYSPPENEEIAARLTQRFDDTEEKVKLRLQTHHQNVEAVLGVYNDIIVKVNGSVWKEDVFAEIYTALSKLRENNSERVAQQPWLPALFDELKIRIT